MGSPDKPPPAPRRQRVRRPPNSAATTRVRPGRQISGERVRNPSTTPTSPRTPSPLTDTLTEQTVKEPRRQKTVSQKAVKTVKQVTTEPVRRKTKVEKQKTDKGKRKKRERVYAEVVTDGLDSSSHDRSEPKHSKRFRRIVRTSTASNGSRSSTTREDSVYVYPKPPSNTTTRRSDRSNSVSEVKQMSPPTAAAVPTTSSSQEGAWALERTKTMASAPRSRMVISENKMKKAQDDLVASHQIHISQVTNLCHIEGELLQNFTDGHLEFTEYMKKLESILESKNKCVESLRAQVACYSLRATY
eukprot:sb/3467306/